jgi:hypothetical protein
MSYPYHRYYANNDQRGHQLFYDQNLEGYPIDNDPNYAVGGYLADGSTFSYGKNCSVKVQDTHYSTPTCCSTWAAAPPREQVCCPLDCNPPVQVAPVMVFPTTIEQELAAAMGRNC